jgi:hypothetical protein
MTGSGVAETNAKKQSAAKDFIVATVAADSVDLESRRRGKGVVLFGDSEGILNYTILGMASRFSGKFEDTKLLPRNNDLRALCIGEKNGQFRCYSFASL